MYTGGRTKIKTKYDYLLFILILGVSAAERGCHQFIKQLEIDEHRHRILLFSREFHINLKVYMFGSDGQSKRLELGQREIKEILLMHSSRPRRGFHGGGRSRSGSRSGC